jgi:hypothetical protein
MNQLIHQSVYDWICSSLISHQEVIIYNEKIISADRFPGIASQIPFLALFQDDLETHLTTMINGFLVPALSKIAISDLLHFDINMDEYEALVLVSEFRNRMFELANIKPDQEEDAFNRFVQEKRIEKTVSHVQDLLKQEYIKAMPCFREIFYPGVWIKQNQIYPLTAGKEEVFEELTHRIAHVYNELFPQLPDLYSSVENNPFIRLHFNSLLFANHSLRRKLQRKIQGLWKKVEKKLLTSQAQMTTIDQFTSLLDDRVNSTYQVIRDTLQKDSQDVLQNLKETMSPYQRMVSSGLIFRDLMCGNYEIRFSPGSVYIGEHTRDYLIQSENMMNYYYFKDAFVAAKFGSIMDLLNSKRRNNIPHPIVANRYGPHLFIKEANTAEQPICMGTTNLNAMLDASLPFSDRVMNIIHMGVKVLRDGHHSKNKNNYYHKLTEEIFNNQLVYYTSLGSFKNYYISHYYR